MGGAECHLREGPQEPLELRPNPAMTGKCDSGTAAQELGWRLPWNRYRSCKELLWFALELIAGNAKHLTLPNLGSLEEFPVSVFPRVLFHCLESSLDT